MSKESVGMCGTSQENLGELVGLVEFLGVGEMTGQKNLSEYVELVKRVLWSRTN